MRPNVFDLYTMKTERRPAEVKAAWLRAWPGEQPASSDWKLVGRERHPSRLTIAEMQRSGSCYREIPNWLDTCSWYNSK
jgi:hypothetical protein